MTSVQQMRRSFKCRTSKGAFVYGCRATDGTAVFLHVEGAQTRDIVLSGNHLKRVVQAVSVGEDMGASAVEEG